MKNNVAKILISVAVLGILALFQQALAIGEDFTVELSPEVPAPNQTVSAKIISYSFDVDRSDISWIVNGAVKLSGTGKRNFSFSVGNIGSKTTLSIVIITKDGLKLDKTMTFQPAGLDILWEADTYTPVSYKAKAIPSSESIIKVSAFPEFYSNGEKISASQLIYDWEINFKNKPDISGFGKRSFSFRSSGVFGEDSVKVTVSSYNKNIIAEKKIKIKIGEPKIIFYKDNPMEGVNYNSALGSEIELGENEISVRAEPYFFSSKNLNSLSYQWKMNNQSMEPGEKKNTADFRVDSGPGSALINLRIQNPINVLQFTEKSLKINFGI